MCKNNEHNYSILREGFSKRRKLEDNIGISNSFDQLIAYSTLFCVKCGNTIEVISADFNPKESK